MRVAFKRNVVQKSSEERFYCIWRQSMFPAAITGS